MNLLDANQPQCESAPQPIRTQQIDELTVQVYESPEAVALAASAIAIQTLRAAVEQTGNARAIFATGRSQIQFLDHLTQPNLLDWSKITGFHLDEYLGITATHPASFRYYLNTHLTSKVNLQEWYGLEGDGWLPLEVCRTYEKKLRQAPIHLCCLGIGNNGHLAFNDPAVANFKDPDWVKLVRLDEKNRQQQADSNAFPNLQAVPQYAFTLTLSAIRASLLNLCIAFGENKSAVIQRAVTGSIGAECPASFLRQIPQSMLLVDRTAAKHLA